jgi:hypothetical protein
VSGFLLHLRSSLHPSGLWHRHTASSSEWPTPLTPRATSASSSPSLAESPLDDDDSSSHSPSASSTLATGNPCRCCMRRAHSKHSTAATTSHNAPARPGTQLCPPTEIAVAPPPRPLPFLRRIISARLWNLRSSHLQLRPTTARATSAPFFVISPASPTVGDRWLAAEGETATALTAAPRVFVHEPLLLPGLSDGAHLPRGCVARGVARLLPMLHGAAVASAVLIEHLPLHALRALFQQLHPKLHRDAALGGDLGTVRHEAHLDGILYVRVAAEHRHIPACQPPQAD